MTGSDDVRWRLDPDDPVAPAQGPRVLGVELCLEVTRVLPDLTDDIWTAAVLEAERWWGCGLEDGTADARHWLAAGPEWRAELRARWVPGGAVLEAEHFRSPPGPWLVAVTLLFGATAMTVAAMLLGRTAGWQEWAIVALLAAVPLIVAGTTFALESARTRRIRRRLDRVIRRADQVAWHRVTILEDAIDLEAESVPVVIEDVRGPEWLDADELSGLEDARPAQVGAADLRHARRVVARHTAVERQPLKAVPEGFTEWHPKT